ncbi:HAD-IA family hydrolase [Halobacillus litoralis]|uniref:HAD-IA family hydrolase n=1 Tax=Halobacillus litoralis TaxID=45668 RepID=UPI001CD636B5|nr:HAD-IA family hydrolase [Halobacillus litoralis]MCA0969273.1 HAD-IA family hydrolase [Halobacillus litoralis]
MYKHIIWDFDGTLFDTYPVMAGIFERTLKEEGIEETSDQILSHMKVSMSATEKHYKENYAIDDHFINRFHAKRKDIEIEQSEPFDHIAEVCRAIHQSGRKNYLYTHRGRSSIEMLKKFDLYDYFTDFITSEHGFERKPSPNALLHLSEKHQITTSEAVMIGDRDLDLLAGKHAGMDAIYFSGRPEQNEHADHSITDFQQLLPILNLHNNK